MIIYDEIEQGTDEWLKLRSEKITGKVLPEIDGTPQAREKVLYKMLAAKYGVFDDEENSMERGNRLEPEARIQYEILTGYTVDTPGFCESNEHEEIANSPDGLIQLEEGYEGAIEIKCLSGWKHLKAKIENEIPKEHQKQVVQYFIVNEDLKWLDFVLYNPDLLEHQLVVIRKTREDLKDEIERLYKKQIDFLEEVRQLDNKLKNI